MELLDIISELLRRRQKSGHRKSIQERISYEEHEKDLYFSDNLYPAGHADHSPAMAIYQQATNHKLLPVNLNPK